jgi:hypothetical protein
MRLKRFLVPSFVLASLAFAPLTRAQNKTTPPVTKPAFEQEVDGYQKPVPNAPKDHVPGPAPKRDLTGIWEPLPYRSGVFPTGPRDMPEDGKHILPFTPEGKAAFDANKPGNGPHAVTINENNDPFNICDPVGFPRVELNALKAIQFFQTPKQVVVIYENDQVWRNIWTDGRELPKEILEPRWYGYSVGKWTDDTTFVVDTIGLDTRTWLDNVGRPHSEDLKVEETFHRVNSDLTELSVTIIDPKYYSKPWVALNKFPLQIRPDWFDIREQICSASEAAQFNSVSGEK